MENISCKFILGMNEQKVGSLKGADRDEGIELGLPN